MTVANRPVNVTDRFAFAGARVAGRIDVPCAPALRTPV
jgi:hypothetical protein